MHVTFVNGTPQQQLWFKQALARSQAPPSTTGTESLVPHRLWRACTADVEVEWVPSSEIPPAAGSGVQMLFAEVSWSGSPVSATMKIADDLDQFVPSREPYNGEAFYKEVIVHEWMHLLQAEMSPLNRERIIESFGGGAWDSGAWAQQIQEADAETGKDLFADPAQRRFLNRTAHRLPEDQLDLWLAQHYVLDPDAPVSGVMGELSPPEWPSTLLEGGPLPAPTPWSSTAPNLIEAGETFSIWELEIDHPHVLGGVNQSFYGFRLEQGGSWGDAHTFRYVMRVLDGDGVIIADSPFWDSSPVLWSGTAFGGLSPSAPAVGAITASGLFNVYLPAPHTLAVRFAFAGGSPGSLPGVLSVEGAQYWTPRFTEMWARPPYPDYPDLGTIAATTADAGTVRSRNRIVGAPARGAAFPGAAGEVSAT